MSDTIQIRYGGHDELYNISAFLNNCWRAEYGQIVAADYLNTMSVEERYKRLLLRYDEGASEFLMMLDGDLLAGVAVFGKSFTDGYEEDGEISAIYLHKDCIGKGHGHRLFVDLLSDNSRALRFYLRHGYQKLADRHIGRDRLPVGCSSEKESPHHTAGTAE